MTARSWRPCRRSSRLMYACSSLSFDCPLHLFTSLSCDDILSPQSIFFVCKFCVQNSPLCEEGGRGFLLQSNFTTPASMVHFAHLHDIFYIMLPRALFQLRCIAHVIPFLFSPRLITIILPAKTLPSSSMKRRMPPLTSSCRSFSHPPQSGTCCTRHKTNRNPSK